MAENASPAGPDHGDRMTKIGRRVDLTGRVVHMLTVIGPSVDPAKPLHWRCLCRCGNHKDVRGDLLRRFDVRSCGCYKPEYRGREDLRGADRDMLNRFDSGETVESIAELYRCNEETVRRRLAIHGVKFTKRRYTLDEDYFGEVDTEDRAYFLGFLYADGNHTRTKKKRTIRLSIKNDDKHILEEFNRVTQHGKPIRDGCGTGNMCEIEFASQKWSDDLLRHGMPPAKTFILEYPDWLRDDLQRHFLRGYSDGDGGFSVRRAKENWTPSISWNLTGTLKFCDAVGKLLKDRLGVNHYLGCRFPGRGNCIRTMTVGGNHQVSKVIDFMYDDANYFLTRKWEMAKSFSHYLGPFRRYEYRGERLTLAEIADRNGTYPNLIYQRIQLGWPVEEAATTPVKRRGNV